MAHFTGSGLVVTFGGTTLTADFRSFSESEEMGLVDSSAGADTNRSYLTTLKDGKATLEIVAPAGGSAVWNAVVPGTSGTLIWAPEGTATGKNKHTVSSAIVMNRDKEMPYDNIVVIKVEFQFSGTVTDSVY